jgi:hypothetical protein
LIVPVLVGIEKYLTTDPVVTGKSAVVFSSLLENLHRCLGPQPVVTGALSPEQQVPGYRPDHSSISTAEIENGWRYTSTAAYILMV